MNHVLSLQRLSASGLDPCIWSDLSCASNASCESKTSVYTVETGTT